MSSEGQQTADGGLLLTLIVCLIVYTLLTTLFLCCRKRFPYVYYPNELENENQKKLFRWILPTLTIPENVVMKRNGIKAALFLEWKTSTIYFLCFVCITTLPVLIPIYWKNSPYDFFTAMAASGLSPNNDITWLTFAYSIVLSVYILSMLAYHRYRYFFLSRKHRRMGGIYLHALKMFGVNKKLSDDEELKKEIMDQNPELEGLYSVHIAWHFPSLWNDQRRKELLEENLKSYQDILDNKSKRPKMRPKRFKLPGLLTCNKKVDAIDWSEEELKKVKEKIKKKQEKLLNKPTKYHSGIAFLLFDFPRQKNQFKNSFSSKKHLGLISKWRFKNAKNAEDILWNNLNSSWYIRTIPQIITNAFMVILAAIWAIPIAFLSQLSNFTGIPGIGTAIEYFINLSPWLQSLCESLLPALLTMIFYAILPGFTVKLSSFEKHHSLSSLQSSAMIKMWIFYILNGLVFLLLFMGSINIADNIATIADWQNAFGKLNWSKYGSFYCNWLLVQTFIGGGLKLVAPSELIKKNLLRFLNRKGTERQKSQIYIPSERKYFVSFAQEALYIAVCILFAPIVPLVSACGFVFYCINQAHDKIGITLMTKYEILKGGKMLNRFGLFICITMLFVYICWTFFFLAHGPKLIGYVAGPIYLSFWILFVIVIVTSNYVVKFINQRRGLVLDYDADSEDLSSDPYLFPGLREHSLDYCEEAL